MDTDGKLNFRLAVACPFHVPCVDRGQHRLRAGDGVDGILLTDVRCAESRHQAIAQELVECTFMLEDDLLQSSMKLPEQSDHAATALLLGESRKPDDVGEHDGD